MGPAVAPSVNPRPHVVTAGNRSHLRKHAISPETEQLPPLCLLVADSDRGSRENLTKMGNELGFRTLCADSLLVAHEHLRCHYVDLLLVSLPMTDKSGEALIYEVLTLRPEIDILLLSARADEKPTLELVKSGVRSYLRRPFTDTSLKRMLERARQQRVLEARFRRYSLIRARTKKVEPMLGSSRQIVSVRRMMGMVARSSTAVLLTGENGTGKTLAATNIAFHSHSRMKELRVLNCMELPPGLLDDALFGHFVVGEDGGIREEIGLLASPLSILLDEIDWMDLPIQSKLLCALRDGIVYQNGAPDNPRPLKARVLAASATDLCTLCQQNHFREDLFAILNLSRIELPPLRERSSDIPELVEAVLQRAYEYRGRKHECSKEALSFLTTYPWPGNVTELERTVERACSLASQPVLHVSQMQALTRLPKGMPAEDTANGAHAPILPLAVRERAAIEQALRLKRGNREVVAQLLGISRQTLWRKIDVYEIDIPDLT